MINKLNSDNKLSKLVTIALLIYGVYLSVDFVYSNIFYVKKDYVAVEFSIEPRVLEQGFYWKSSQDAQIFYYKKRRTITYNGIESTVVIGK